MKKNLLLLIVVLSIITNSYSQLDTCFSPVLMVKHGSTYSTSSMGFADGDTLHLSAFFNGNRNLSTLGYTVSSIPYAPYTGSTFFAGSIPSNGWSPVVTLPFTVSFFGCDYTTLRIGENGIISFDNTLTSTSACPNVITGAAPNTNIPKSKYYGSIPRLSYCINFYNNQWYIPM